MGGAWASGSQPAVFFDAAVHGGTQTDPRDGRATAATRSQEALLFCTESLAVRAAALSARV